MKKKYFDKTEAIGAMYELKKQGYVDIVLELLPDKIDKYAGCLFLGCNEGHKEYITPNIDGDFITSWATEDWGQMRRYYYWWIFD